MLNAEMFYGQSMTFEQIIERLGVLQHEINQAR